MSGRAVAERRARAGWMAVEFRFEIRCAAGELRVASAQPLDLAGRPVGGPQINPEGFEPIHTAETRLVARLACSEDRTGLTRVPDGMDASAHAARLFAALRRPPPTPPPPTAEEEAQFALWARRYEMERMESVARRALVEACGEAGACRGLEAESMRGVAPVVALQGLTCGPRPREGGFRRDCRFEARHTPSARTLSCTFEMREEYGYQGSYWSHRRSAPAQPLPPPSSGAPVPSMPPQGPSSLACSGDVAALIAP
jgi:hypothetical protein